MLFLTIEKNIVFIFVLSILLSTCANIERVGNSTHTNSNEKKEDQQHLAYRENPPRHTTSQTHISPAVSALMTQASDQEASGQLELAASTIERALRIAPQTPQLHLSLARIRLKQNQAHAALQIALKGQSLLVNGYKNLNQDFWRVIGDCYIRLGNTTKANEAYGRI